jgi:hypothetical protein
MKIIASLLANNALASFKAYATAFLTANGVAAVLPSAAFKSDVIESLSLTIPSKEPVAK